MGVMIAIIGGGLIALGIGLSFLSGNIGFTLISIGGDVIVTYVVIDNLLLREDRNKWKNVQLKVENLVQMELNGILSDIMLVSGANNITLTYPVDLTPEEERKYFDREHLKRLRQLSSDLELLGQSAQGTHIDFLGGATGDLFTSRADHLGQLQIRYWTKFLRPTELGFIIELETKLRDLDMDISIAKNIPSTQQNKIRRS